MKARTSYINSIPLKISFSFQKASLQRIGITGGTVYHYDGQYFLSLEDLGSHTAEGVVAVLAEYGNPTTLTIYRLQEYGKLIMDGNAVETIQTHFS